jgi:glycosyltransferase involved in cell wall biosynthesis
MLVNLGVALSKLGCRCVVGVFCDSRFSHTEVGDRARAQGLTVEIVPCVGRCDWRAAAHIRKLLGEYNVDVLHTHGYKADLYACAAAWPRRVALVATCHNWPSRSWSMRAYAALDRLAMRTFDRVVVISEPLAEILQRSGIQVAKLEMIANGVESARFREAQPTLRDEVVLGEELLVGFVGRLAPEKGGEILLRAAQQVLRTRPRTKFVLVGDGPSRQAWELLASQLGIYDRVVFAGVREDMPGVYASFQVVVLPSLCEAMPMCVLEAMAAGKPVIATRVGAVPKLVDQDQTGVLVEPGDVDGLSAAIIQILDDPGWAHRLGENGRARATEHFSADSMARRYVELYREVVDIREGSAKNVLMRSA